MEPQREGKIQKLTIHEIYESVQGESTWAGLPCVFVRLTFCDLRCSWCDTEHAFYDGEKRTLDDIINDVAARECPLVEITGGEPLLQPAVLPLMERLCDQGFTVLIETSGGRDISKVDPRVHRIMDLKCPDSGMCDRNLFDNIEYLNENDEVKFVLASQRDFQWAAEQVRKYDLDKKVRAVLFSVVFGKLDPRDCVDWILKEKLPVRFQLQMHKFIWPPDKRGV